MSCYYSFLSVVSTPVPFWEASSDQEISYYQTDTKSVSCWMDEGTMQSVRLVISFAFTYTDKIALMMLFPSSAWMWDRAKFPWDDNSVIADGD